MFDAAGRMYCSQNSHSTIVYFDQDGTKHEVASNVGCNDLVVLPHGIYSTDPKAHCVWYTPIETSSSNATERPTFGQPRKVAEGIDGANGIGVTPDQAFLCVVDARGRYVWSYQIASDGELMHGQPYWYVHQPLDAMKTGADGMATAADGWIYVATSLGIQAFDQPGRCHGIISKPDPNRSLSNLVFAGPELSTIIATAGDAVYRRKTKINGVAPWQPAAKPERPGL